MSDPSPCPFCGSTKITVEWEPCPPLDKTDTNRRWFAECTHCSCQGPFCQKEPEVIPAWNRRADRLAQLTAENQKLRAALVALHDAAADPGWALWNNPSPIPAAVVQAKEVLATTSAPAVVPREDAEALATAVAACAAKFREYEKLHAAKPDPVKAARNAEMAQVAENTLAAYRAKHPKP